MSAKFEIFLGSNRQYYFRLKAPNGEKILASEGYTTKANCQNGIQSVKAHSPYDNYYNRLTSTNYQYYFTLNASNGQVIGTSETYTTTQAREGGVTAVKAYAPTAPTTDLT
ncbi:YegP family protein [Pseudomonas viridiflava]|uniref:YegP family protein n=1 Tax=Pseudomonas viridiflava TaxID=33069 RepID=UPI000F01B2AC|nr:YegP family protein [Pseudomonas viridiflava]